jgi:uncharacterized protein
MHNEALTKLFKNTKPIIGMVHLRPLPGSPLYAPDTMDMKKILSIAKEEAQILQDAGVDGLQVENIWDYPYARTGRLSYASIASLAVAVNEISSTMSIPVGVNCHLNGGEEALACAVAGQAKWIRVFEWSNAYISQAGFVDAIGAEVARMRSNLKANEVLCMCDVNVKHGSHFIINDRSIEEQSRDIEQQGGDILIVTGFETGIAPTPEKVQSVRDAVALPIFLGSGLSTQNAKDLLKVADGAIVGSWFKTGNNWKNPVDYDRTRAFMYEVEQLRGELK